jgi:hypothetical protein
MSHAKQASKRKHRACAVPLLGAAGLSLSLASGAPAATVGPAAHEITLGEEEISDVSLATFYVFDKENPRTSQPLLQLARGCGCGHGCGHGCAHAGVGCAHAGVGCRGCRGCRFVRGCGGCGCWWGGWGWGGGGCWIWTRWGWVWAC